MGAAFFFSAAPKVLTSIILRWLFCAMAPFRLMDAVAVPFATDRRHKDAFSLLRVLYFAGLVRFVLFLPLHTCFPSATVTVPFIPRCSSVFLYSPEYLFAFCVLDAFGSGWDGSVCHVVTYFAFYSYALYDILCFSVFSGRFISFFFFLLYLPLPSIHLPVLVLLAFFSTSLLPSSLPFMVFFCCLLLFSRRFLHGHRRLRFCLPAVTVACKHFPVLRAILGWDTPTPDFNAVLTYTQPASALYRTIRTLLPCLCRQHRLPADVLLLPLVPPFAVRRHADVRCPGTSLPSGVLWRGTTTLLDGTITQYSTSHGLYGPVTYHGGFVSGCFSCPALSGPGWIAFDA